MQIQGRGVFVFEPPSRVNERAATGCHEYSSGLGIGEFCGVSNMRGVPSRPDNYTGNHSGTSAISPGVIFRRPRFREQWHNRCHALQGSRDPL